jgi:DNA-binding LacI/PurR family transcriptional regulator
MNESKQITHADIAGQTSLSPATASQVMRGGTGIADETREQVFEAASRLGYMPRPNTHHFTGTGPVCVGVIVRSYQGEDIFLDHFFYAAAIEGIKAVCNQNHISTVFAVVPVDENSHILEIPRMVIDRQVDGVVAIGLNLDEESTRQIDRYGVPIVLLDAYSETNAYDSAAIANYQGAYEAVSYLISQGHSRIALLGSSETAFPGIVERRRGYLQALADNGIGEPFLIDSPFDHTEAYNACLAFFKQPTPVTAVFGVNDWLTKSALQALQALDIPVPGRVSMMGFDDAFGDKVSPPLSSMVVDRLGLGHLAMKLLINRLQNPFSVLIKAALRPKLVVRQSILRLELSQEINHAGA